MRVIISMTVRGDDFEHFLGADRHVRHFSTSSKRLARDWLVAGTGKRTFRRHERRSPSSILSSCSWAYDAQGARIWLAIPAGFPDPPMGPWSYPEASAAGAIAARMALTQASSSKGFRKNAAAPPPIAAARWEGSSSAVMMMT
jgi:hypothetical protein